MFIGESNHSIDNKGRYIVPVTFREELGDIFYITKGLDQCLFVYSEQTWQQKVDELANLSSTSANMRRFARNFFSAAQKVMPDKQGRVLISPALRKHAQLEKEIVTIGVSSRLEIWDAAMWQKYNDDDAFDDSSNYEAVAENLPDICL